MSTATRPLSEIAAQWREARKLYAIYSALLERFALGLPPCRDLESPIDRAEPEAIQRIHDWFAQMDERVHVHQLRQLLQTSKLGTEENLRALTTHHLEKETKNEADRDKIDFLLVQYLSSSAPPGFYEKEVSFEEIAQVLEPILGEVGLHPPRWLEPLEKATNDLEELRSLRDLLEQGTLEDMRKLKAGGGEMYFGPTALVAITRFNFMVRRTFVRLIAADLHAIRFSLHELERRGVKSVDCTRAELSAKEPIENLRQICHEWKKPFRAAYAAGQNFKELIEIRSAVEDALAHAPAPGTVMLETAEQSNGVPHSPPTALDLEPTVPTPPPLSSPAMGIGELGISSEPAPPPPAPVAEAPAAEPPPAQSYEAPQPEVNISASADSQAALMQDSPAPEAAQSVSIEEPPAPPAAAMPEPAAEAAPSAESVPAPEAPTATVEATPAPAPEVQAPAPEVEAPAPEAAAPPVSEPEPAPEPKVESAQLVPTPTPMPSSAPIELEMRTAEAKKSEALPELISTAQSAAAAAPALEAVATPSATRAPYSSEHAGSGSEMQSLLEQIGQEVAKLNLKEAVVASVVVGGVKLMLSTWEVAAFPKHDDNSEALQRAVAARMVLVGMLDRRKKGESVDMRMAVKTAQLESAKIQARIGVAKQSKDIDSAVNLAATSKRLLAVLDEAEKPGK